MSDAEAEECRLLSGWYAYSIQGLLAFACIATLVIKRHREKPKRDVVTFMGDLSKQSLGSGLGHFSNLFLSIYISSRAKTTASACAWYLASYLADCTLGLTITLLLLRLVETIIMHRYPSQGGLKFGFYGTPFRFQLFFPQLTLWIIIIIISKVIVLCFLILLSNPLDATFLRPLDTLFIGAPKLELLLVMIIIPVIINSVQFYITDSCIKSHNEHPSLLRRGAEPSSLLAQPFLAIKTTDDESMEPQWSGADGVQLSQLDNPPLPRSV